MPATELALCHACKARPAGTDADVDAAVVPHRITALARDENPAVAHVAGVAIAYRNDVEGWKRQAAAETDPARAEVFRKHAAVSVETAKALEQVAIDAKAVSTS